MTDILTALRMTKNRDMEQLGRKLLGLEQLLEIGRQISCLDQETALKKIMKSIIKLTGARRGVLLLKDDSGRLKFASSYNFNQETLDDNAFEISRSITEKALQGGAVTVVADALSSQFGQNPSIMELGILAMMAIPLTSRTGILGVIYVDTDSMDHQLTDHDTSIFQAFGAQAAVAIENASLHQRLQQENLHLKRAVENEIRFDRIIYRSKAMNHVVDSIKRLLDNDITVLIQGETGTGKELVACAIHHNSSRSGKPFVSQNTGALPDSLLESELFGHRKGSFSGAHENKQGLFERANGGTVFLDEIGEASPAMQIRLLRLLEEGVYRRVGGTTDRKTDVRIITATHRNLKEEVRAGRFRQDLYYRLSTFPMTLPPLRKRREDIPVLTKQFIEFYNKKLGKSIQNVPARAMARLTAHDWPGNVRELKNFVYRMMVMSSTDVLVDVDHCFEMEDYTIQDPVDRELDSELLDDVERKHIEQVLTAANHNQAEAARRLGLKRTTLRSRMEKLKMISNAC